MFRTERPESVKTVIRVGDTPDYFQPEPFYVDWNTNWTALLCMIQAKWGKVANELHVFYWDEEDYVRISSQEELEEALRLAEGTGCLQLYVEPNSTPFPTGIPEETLRIGLKRDPLASGLKCTHSPSSSSSMCARVGSLEHIEGGSEETFPRMWSPPMWSPSQSFSENCQPSELPKAENPKNGSGMSPMQGNKILDPRVTPENQTKPEDSNDAYTAALKYKDKIMADYSEGHLSDDEDEDVMQECMMMPGASSGANVIAIEMPEMEHHGTETAEPAEIAETGEMSTKSGRDAETGFWVQQRNEARLSSREILANYEASLRKKSDEHEELRRYFAQIKEQNAGKLTGRHSINTSTVPVLVKLAPEAKWRRATLANLSPVVKTQLSERMSGKKKTSLRTAEDRAYLQDRLMKLREGKKVSNKSKEVKSSKKHYGREDLSTEDSVSDSMKKADSTKIKCQRAARNSSTTLDSSSPLEMVTETSSDTSSLLKKHEQRPSKSEGKKKKHSEEPLTSKAFFDYMCKFEMTMKKDLTKTVAKKTARTVLKSLPKQGEGSEAASQPPPVATSSGFVHEDIICDCCNREIVGTRYICGNCTNYDLCEECESIQPSFHDRSHVFIKLRRPCLKAGTRRGVRVPLLKKVIYRTKEEMRKVDPERIQVIKERTKGQESHVENQTSRNNNNEREEEDDQQGEFVLEVEKEGELAQLKEYLKRAQDEADYLADTLSCETVLSSTAKGEDAEVGEACEDLEGMEIEPGMEPVPTESELKNVLAGAMEQCMKPLESADPDQPATLADGMWPDVFDRVPWNGGRTHKLPVPYEFLDMDVEFIGDVPSAKPEKEEPTKMLSGCVLWDEEDSASPEFKIMEDGFMMFQPFREASSESEAMPASHTELTDATIPPQAEVKLSSDDRTDWQQQETDDVSSFSSLDSSSDEEFVVILPDCFDVSKPLRLEITADSPDSDGISLEEDAHSNVPALGSDKEPEGPIQPAGISDGPENEADENDQNTPSADIPSSLSSVPESNAAGESKEEEEDFEGEEHVSVGDLIAAFQEELLVTRSTQTTTEKPEDSSLNTEETDVKKLPEPEEEGAAAAAAGENTDMMTKTFQVASSGLQHLFQTGKDIFKTLQSGDSYECKESTYDLKPSGYTLPESTWKPSTKEYVPPKSTFTLPKSEFQMPKSSYVAPQHPGIPGASVYTGEYAGPVQRIREMGYFNNERIVALLRKYDGDIPKVVDELIEETDGDWAQRRHGNRS